MSFFEEVPVNCMILVIRDLYTAIRLAEKNKVTFVSDDPEAIKLFDKVVRSNGLFGNDDESVFINTEEDKNAWMNWIKGLTMNFDYAILNPPYTKKVEEGRKRALDLDLPIYKKVCEFTKNVVCIMRASCANKKSCKFTDYLNVDNNPFKEVAISTAIYAHIEGEPCIKYISNYETNGKNKWIEENTVNNSFRDHIDHNKGNEWYYKTSEWVKYNKVPENYIAFTERTSSISVYLEGESLLNNKGKRRECICFIPVKSKDKQLKIKKWLLNDVNIKFDEYCKKYGQLHVDRGFAKCIPWPDELN